jgi:hypothetical protein
MWYNSYIMTFYDSFNQKNYIVTNRCNWWHRLRAAGLLPLARLVEGDMIADRARPAERATCFHFDMSLLAALLDRWRPETHMFHMIVGEMAPTLQDVSLLLGLPCAR